MSRKRDEIEARDRERCKHFNGHSNKTCRAGVCYDDLFYPQGKERPVFGQRPSLNPAPNWIPCIPQGDHDKRPIAPCDKYELYTEEELAERRRIGEQRDAWMRQGLSPCCGGEIDTSQVIHRPGTRSHGHGPRFCKTCRKCCFIV